MPVLAFQVNICSLHDTVNRPIAELVILVYHSFHPNHLLTTKIGFIG